MQLVELFRHQNPRGDLTIIVERALCELLKRTMKRRFAQTNSDERKGSRKPVSPSPDVGASIKVDVGASIKADVGASIKADVGVSTKADVSASSKADVSAHTHDGWTATTHDCLTDTRADGWVNANAEVNAPRKQGRSPESRYIPRAVLREVHARDRGQCTYVSPDGRRCMERGFLEVHHHNTTFALGGEATIENLRLVCRTHNLFLAERDYSRAFMQAKLREAIARKQLSLVPGTERV